MDPFSCLSALVPERTARWGLCPFLSPEAAPLLPGWHPITPLSGCLPSVSLQHTSIQCSWGPCHPQPCAMAVHVLGLSLSIISLRTGTSSTCTLTMPSAEILDKYLIRFDFIVSIRVRETAVFSCHHARSWRTLWFGKKHRINTCARLHVGKQDGYWRVTRGDTDTFSSSSLAVLPHFILFAVEMFTGFLFSSLF